ncbi:unnamed protein product [Periconia digitata]|uniref:Malate dehydrogenase n=1 Tax=Periconia digitata TaxID=1303443 RepID=A0A9W4UKD5_9PLEO|nr:unnamed protein product [Periconia digitata]
MRCSFALTFLVAVAPTTLFAAPTPMEKRAPGSEVCDISKAVVPQAPTPLPAPTGTLAYVAIGRGTQNYTCAATPNSSEGSPKAIGAMATLYNATCTAVQAPMVLNDTPAIALKTPPTIGVPVEKESTDGPVSGHHYFNAAGSPVFETEYGWVQAKGFANSTAPATADKGKNGLGSVAWLKLLGTAGDWKEVYRVDTAGGVAPKTCANIEGTFEVEYAAVYWFYA